ncbi:hypothetical protein TARUN_4042 [Trichoderma arundinaceum]|uniref:DUF8035 domain-containing protein n=1 Tax=Trichoderma arundinaceum TaxID=490622 RepID=A0A395NQI7_TRIAR|nr:hypothetical protein TARUN_4042 [Trichoderma arundinaceum]
MGVSSLPSPFLFFLFLHVSQLSLSLVGPSSIPSGDIDYTSIASRFSSLPAPSSGSAKAAPSQPTTIRADQPAEPPQPAKQPCISRGHTRARRPLFNCGLTLDSNFDFAFDLPRYSALFRLASHHIVSYRIASHIVEQQLPLVSQLAMNGSSVVQHVDAVDAFASTLYLRTSQSTVPSLSADASQAVRNLHHALRDLRIEAADPDSRLNGSDSSTYSKQLGSIIKDSQTTLKQLELVLDLNSRGGGPYADGVAEGIAAVQTKLVHQKTVIDAFLDLVQLSNSMPSSSRRGPGLEYIKEKVDAIGRKLFRRDSNSKPASGDDKLWKRFKAELVKEGFSSKVLDEHEDILRAYIQEIETMLSAKDGAPPTVQGLLELDGNSVPAPTPIHARHMTFPPADYHKAPTSMKTERLMPDQPPFPSLAQELSYDPRSWASSDGDGKINDSFTLISTRDLLMMDSLSADMAGLHLTGSPPQADAPTFQPIMSGALQPPEAKLPGSTAPQDIPQMKQLGVDGVPHVYGSSAPPAYGGAPMPRLAPDSYGRDIPMHAEWTKINRSVVSPEALHRAGVRYEARPGYVAILGRLSLDQVTHYARLSAECRAARQVKPPIKQHSRSATKHERTGSESSRDDNAEDDKDSERRSDLSDADDDKGPDEKGTKSYPIIVSPPEKGKTSPTSPVTPKSILKNKNTNHVRFDPEPHEVDARQEKESRENRDSASSRKPRDRDDRDRDDHPKRRDDRDRRRRDSDPSYGDKHRRDRDRDRDRDDGYRSHHSERDRRDDRRRDRSAKKTPWGEALGVVGIGGAAASLLGVLAEAAMGG